MYIRCIFLEKEIIFCSNQVYYKEKDGYFGNLKSRAFLVQMANEQASKANSMGNIFEKELPHHPTSHTS